MSDEITGPILRKQSSGWELEDADREVVLEGEYPLREDTDFVEMAAEALDNWQYHDKPYTSVDERDESIEHD